MNEAQDQLLHQQLIDRLIKAGLSENKAKEAIITFLSVYCLAQDRKELVREVEELAVLFEEGSLGETEAEQIKKSAVQIALAEKAKHHIA